MALISRCRFAPSSDRKLVINFSRSNRGGAAIANAVYETHPSEGGSLNCKIHGINVHAKEEFLRRWLNQWISFSRSSVAAVAHNNSPQSNWQRCRKKPKRPKCALNKSRSALLPIYGFKFSMCAFKGVGLARLFKLRSSSGDLHKKSNGKQFRLVSTFAFLFSVHSHYTHSLGESSLNIYQ